MTPMINVHAAANAAVQAVNPDITGTFYASIGYVLNTARKQVAQFAVGVDVPMQVQGVSAKDLRHADRLNMQEVLRSVHMFGNTQGVVRVNNKGGDLLYFPEVPGGTPRIWKVFKVMETWRDWCRVLVALQTDTAPPPPPP